MDLLGLLERRHPAKAGKVWNMRLNRESLYGLKALTFLARLPEGAIVPLREIAELGHLPSSFLSKIFRQLVQHGIVHSYRGKQRGYALAKSSDAVSLREVLEAIQGPDLFSRCVFWSQHCEEEFLCPLHAYWQEVRDPLFRSLERATLKDLAENVVETEAKRTWGRRRKQVSPQGGSECDEERLGGPS